MIAVAPAQWATEDSVPVDLDAAVREGFVGARIRVVDARAAVEERGQGCSADEACVEAAAREAGAEKLLRTKLATLGGTVLVRMGVVDVATGTRAEERQEVVNAATPDRVRAAIASLAKQIAKPYVPPPPPPPPRVVHEQARWYQQWWVWTLVGAAVVGTGIGVGVAATAGDPGPDVVVTPP